MKTLYAVATALVLGTFNSACMETGALQGAVGLQSGSNYSMTIQDDQETCMSGEWNATPSSSLGYPGEFHVCGDDTDAYKLHIDGELKIKAGGSYIGYEVASRVCVFPSQVYDYGGATGKVAIFKADEAGFPMYSCFEVNADEDTGEFNSVSLRFNLTTFDSAFIIDSRYFNQMRTCLLSGNDSSCPDYAFGQFRTLDSSDLTQDQ